MAKRVQYPVVSLHPGVATGTGMLQHMGLQLGSVEEISTDPGHNACEMPLETALQLSIIGISP